METSLDFTQLQSRPSLFEALAAEELQRLLGPSLELVLSHLTQRYPRVLLPILARFDGLNALLATGVQTLYLHQSDATLIEKFYGLRRAQKFGEPLTRLTKLVTLLEIVWLPYISKKLDRLALGAAAAASPGAKIWPVLKLIAKVLDVVVKLLYMSNKTQSITPLGLLFGISLTRQNPPQQPAATAGGASRSGQLFSPQSENIANVVTTLRFVKSITGKIVWISLDKLLPLSLFLLKFAQWYQENKPEDTRDNVFKPPVPYTKPVDCDRSGCSICKGPIVNAAMTNAGYVYCYRCIYEHLRDCDESTGGRDPLSGRVLTGLRYESGRWAGLEKVIRRVIL